jgi:RTX calcium-binding nonapeptide repeat (4 copies)
MRLMRKTVLVFASIALAMLVASGVALAANVKGDENNNVLTGTPSRDTIIPFGGDDTVYALGGNDDVRHSYGNDYLFGGSGADTLRGGFGSDIIWGGPGKDLIDCAYLESRDKGEAYDIAHADAEDTVVDCEEVRRPNDPLLGHLFQKTDDKTRIAVDPVTGAPILDPVIGEPMLTTQ